jgi:hypothetical protein
MSIKYGDDKIPYIDLGDDYKICLEYEELSEAEAEKANTELRETAELKASALAEFKEMIKGNVRVVLARSVRGSLSA